VSDVAIRVEGLSKRYRIGKSRAGRTFREALAGVVTAPFRRSAKSGGNSDFWALKDVSFEVSRGEVVGIIGRNGAGKSTLLKILSRITEPTSGRAEVYGRVGSLLEVGTGFHPELTGRENIYLNGAILGMKRREIDRRFDEIVDFAEVEKFIETPVKHYSSGMYVRLAFAVAAHLEPEILIVDEVLAVGDAEFQRKCLGKMEDAATQGRTVLLVSHSLGTVQNLCQRVLYVSSGRIACDSDADECVNAYLQSFERSTGTTSLKTLPRQEGHVPIITGIELLDETGAAAEVVASGRPVTIRIHYEHTESLPNPFFGVRFVTPNGVNLFVLETQMQGATWGKLPAKGTLACTVPMLPTVPGTYYLSPSCGTYNHPLDLVERARKVHVVHSDYFGTGKLPDPINGLVIVDADWKLELAAQAMER
jgi:lipopolysaccharide transport system ATP-binding protein